MQPKQVPWVPSLQAVPVMSLCPGVHLQEMPQTSASDCLWKTTKPKLVLSLESQIRKSYP